MWRGGRPCAIRCCGERSRACCSRRSSSPGALCLHRRARLVRLWRRCCRPTPARSPTAARPGEVRENPQTRDKVRALFAADWGPPTPGGIGKLTLAAPQYFELGGPLRMVHIGAGDYIAITGCAPQACTSRRGLLLIREGGDQLMARLDDGGFS